MYFTVLMYYIVILTRFVIGGHTDISIKKRRLCVDVVVDNYRSDADVLVANVGIAQKQCFSQCVRNVLCNVFNFQIDGGT